MTGAIDNITTEAGEKIDVAIDLSALFTDADDGDKAIRWELSNAPAWLGLSVEYVTEDGVEKAIGHLRGTPTSSDDAAHKVTLTAKDAGGAAAEISFHVIVDDGNDSVTRVNLLSDTGSPLAEAEVDENDASGVVLGKVTVDDIDHHMHPNGMHKVTVNDPRFEIREDAAGAMWLALKEGESLDHEADNDGDGNSGGDVLVTVTAVDMSGEVYTSGPNAGKPMEHTTKSATFAVVINDRNDAPEAQTVGNWWVTVDDDLEADDVSAGRWLNFALETDDGDFDRTTGDKFPAFTDQDIQAGDKLTYSISGPSWLEIDKDSGVMTNAKGALPARGVYGVTVTATDKAGASASASFELNVALSGPDDNYTDDNEEPSIRITSEVDYVEGSGAQRVATFTVTDKDQDIPDHEFAITKVEIISVKNPDNAGDTYNATLRDHDNNPNTPMGLYTATATAAAPNRGYATTFVLSDPVRNGDTWTYHIYARNTYPDWLIGFDSLDILSHERSDEIEIEVRVTDGTGTTETAKLEFDIEDANEAPNALGQVSASSTAASTLPSRNINLTSRTLTVNHADDQAVITEKVVLYIKLYDVWSDVDGDDDDDLTYGASSSASWIKVKALGEWGGRRKGRGR